MHSPRSTTEPLLGRACSAEIQKPCKRSRHDSARQRFLSGMGFGGCGAAHSVHSKVPTGQALSGESGVNMISMWVEHRDEATARGWGAGAVRAGGVAGGGARGLAGQEGCSCRHTCALLLMCIALLRALGERIQEPAMTASASHHALPRSWAREGAGLQARARARARRTPPKPSVASLAAQDGPPRVLC